MREIKCYQCEICNTVYRHEKRAKECESIGKPQQLANIGDIFTYKYTVSGFDCEITIKIYKVINKGHFFIYKFMSKLNNGWERGLYGRDEIWGNEEFLRRIKT